MPFNGGKILEAGSKRLLSAQLLDTDLIPQLYRLVQEHGANILTYTEEHILTEREDDPYAEKEVVITGMPLKRVPNFVEAATESLPKCLAVGPLEKLIPLEAAVKEQLGTRVGAFRSSDYFLELVPLGVNKGSALARLLDGLGMTPQDLIAIGDNYNDLEMIELAGSGLLDGLEPNASLVLDAMPARAAASTESIVRSSGLSPKETRSALGILELEGKVERTATGWRRRR